MTDTTDPYMKYLDSPFFNTAFLVCPYEHQRGMFCAVCRHITFALEEVYEQGRTDREMEIAKENPQLDE